MLPGLRYEYPFEAGLRTVSLRPLEDQKFELVIWGANSESLRHASRLEPTITGSRQPDYVVDNGRCCWEGAAGVYDQSFRPIMADLPGLLPRHRFNIVVQS